MEIKTVKRRSKPKQSEMLTLRLTPEENDFIRELKDDLEFDTIRELVLFCLDVVRNLRDWESEGQQFYVGTKAEGFSPVEFQFSKQPKP